MGLILPSSVYFSSTLLLLCPRLLELLFSQFLSVLPRWDNEVVITLLPVDPNAQPQPLIKSPHSTGSRLQFDPRKLRVPFLGRYADGIGSGGRESELTDTDRDGGTNGADRAGGRDSGCGHVSVWVWRELCHRECMGG